MIQRRCNYPGCRTLIDYSEAYCPKHKGSAGVQYNRDIRTNSDIQTANGHTNKEISNFYNSSEWKRVRKSRLIQDSYICQNCLREGHVTPATIVHHTTELRSPEGWEHRLDIDRLESICQECHNREDHSWSRRKKH